MSDDSGAIYVMLGAGGHARVLQEILTLAEKSLAGYIAPDDSHARLGDVPRLGDDEHLQQLDPQAVTLVNGIGSVSDLSLRKSVYVVAKELGFQFLTVVDSTAVVRPSARLGKGAQVLAGAVVGADAWVGDNAIVNSGAIIDHDVRLGDHSHVSPGAVVAGDVSIGESSHIGLGARIIQGVVVGDKCVVGAGSVLLRSIPDRFIAVGIPAVAIARNDSKKN